jgi:hypothetical protein
MIQADPRWLSAALEHLDVAVLGVALGLLPANARVIIFLVLISVAGGTIITILIIRPVAYGGRRREA